MRLNSLLWVTPMVFSAVAFFNQVDTQASHSSDIIIEKTNNQPLDDEKDSVSVGFYRKRPRKNHRYLLLNTPVDYAPTRQQLKHLPVYLPPVDVENYYLGQLYRNLSGTLIFGHRVPSDVLLERPLKN